METQGKGAVALKLVEAVRAKQERDQGHMGAVHSLKRYTGGGAIKVSLSYEVLHGLKDFLEQTRLRKLRFEHRC